MNPIPELAAAIRDTAPEALILVDTVSSLGAVPFDMDGWGIDVVATASQKAWMAAPGLAMVAASPRAWAAMETARMPRFYLDLRRHRDAMVDGETPWTPAVAVAFQVDEGIRLMNEEGQAGVFARHVACAAAAQAGLEALGFQLFAEPTHRSRTVTAAWIPDGLDWKGFNGELKRQQLVLAGGQGKLTGKIFRLGHLGSVTVDEILGAIAVLERVSLEEGQPIEPGRAVGAAQAAAIGVLRGRDGGPSSSGSTTARRSPEPAPVPA
jgi:aspartate aminotransferase-like enzyme